jgi:hypothetical protein
MGCSISALTGGKSEEIPDFLKYHIPFDNLIIIDSLIDPKNDLAASATSFTLVISFHSNRHNLSQLCNMIKKALIKNLSPFKSVGFVSHATAAGEKWKIAVDVTATILPNESLSTILQLMDLFNTITAATSKNGDGRVDIFGCNLLARDPSLVEELEQLYGLKFTMSDDRTGEQIAGGKWIEESPNLNITSCYFDIEKLNQFKTSVSFLDSIANFFGGSSATVQETSDALSGAIINKPGDFLSGRNKAVEGKRIK